MDIDLPPQKKLPDAPMVATPRDRNPLQKVGVYAWYVLAVLVIVYTVNFVDRQILSILAQDIKVDLHLSDSQLGFLYGTTFAIFYAIFGLPLGRLADSWYRARLIAIGLAVWSSMTTLSAFSNTYTQLSVARMGVGIGEASASPAAFSMIGDYFGKSRRAFAAAIYSCGVYLGMGLSLPIGGWISSSWTAAFSNQAAPLNLRGWQATFLFVGLPGLLLALWVWSLFEPERLGQKGGSLPLASRRAWLQFAADLMSVIPPFTFWVASRHPGELLRNCVVLALVAAVAAALGKLTGDWVQWIAYGFGVYSIFSWIQTKRWLDMPTHTLLWGTGEVWFALFGFGSLAVITYAFGFWAAPFAIRTFHVGPALAGTALGIPGALASAVGVITGGKLSDVWKRHDQRGRLFVGMLSASLTIPTMSATFLAPTFEWYALLCPLVYFSANFWVGSAVATYQDFVLPRMYGTAGATYLLGSTMIGLALGPYLSGKVSTLTGSLQTGVFSLLAAPVLALFFLFLVSRTASAVEDSKVARARLAGEQI